MLFQFEAEVVSCKAASLPTRGGGGKEGKKKVAAREGFQVVCNDSVLFPEGGGQNGDRGTLDGRRVAEVARRGRDAVLFVEGGDGHGEEPFREGQRVKQVVDWGRRFDHMQQHTGQHLVREEEGEVLLSRRDF